MDEGKKAASVSQLKELHDAVMPRIEALESRETDEGDPMQDALVQTIAGRLVMVEAKLDQLAEKMAQPAAPDFAPVLAALAKLGEQQLAMLTKCMQDMAEMSSKPVTKTGEALLPDGGRIRLQISETRM